MPTDSILHERKSSYTHPNQNDYDRISEYNGLDIELFNTWKENNQGIGRQDTTPDGNSTTLHYRR
ncbi:unnamed protein product [marine sediment metagenome]|uniref:Uncharacterized protein n=1 Tax=marine sediment metagenome TaxID=412755 RepID=X1DPC2_9ZZZZ